MFKAEEDTLLKPGLSHDVRYFFVLLEKGVSLAEGKPQDVGSAELALTSTLNNTVQEVVLGLSALNEVSPAAQEVSHLELRTTMHQPV